MSSGDPFVPAGRSREVRHLGAAAIGGAPVAYVIVLSTVVTTLAFIPFSVVLSSGGSMPMSQGVLPLVGWILGPVAGAVSAAIGALAGAFLAPHTAGIVFLTVGGAAVAALAAGSMGRRGPLRPALGVLFVAALAWFDGRALLVNGVHLRAVAAGSAVDSTGVLLFLLPTSGLAVRWIRDPRLPRVAAGLLLGTWIVSAVTHVTQAAISYTMFNWPEPVWITLIPIIPLENLARSVIGAVIGTGVLSGLRAVGVLRPREAVY